MLRQIMALLTELGADSVNIEATANNLTVTLTKKVGDRTKRLRHSFTSLQIDLIVDEGILVDEILRRWCSPPPLA